MARATHAAWSTMIRTPQHILVVGAVGLALLLGASVRFVEVPLGHRIARKWSRLHAVRAQSTAARELERRLAEQQARLQETQAALAAIKLHVGNVQGMAKALETLRQHAVRHHVDLTVTQQPAEQEAGVLTLAPDLVLHDVPLTLHLEGRYRDIGAFLGALTSLPFVSTVREWQIQHSTTHPTRLEGTVHLALYLLQGSSS